MAKCDYCGSTIIFGGKRNGTLRFCNNRCFQGWTLLVISQETPDNIVQQQVWSVHEGRCPKCNGPGPVDVHVSHPVWSALVFTSCTSQPTVSCRTCGVKGQMGDAMFSLILGWWGFPWGLVMTPVQIARNVLGLIRGRGSDVTAPSAQLERIVRMDIAAHAVAQHYSRPNA